MSQNVTAAIDGEQVKDLMDRLEKIEKAVDRIASIQLLVYLESKLERFKKLKHAGQRDKIPQSEIETVVKKMEQIQQDLYLDDGK